MARGTHFYSIKPAIGSDSILGKQFRVGVRERQKPQHLAFRAIHLPEYITRFYAVYLTACCVFVAFFIFCISLWLFILVVPQPVDVFVLASSPFSVYSPMCA